MVTIYRTLLARGYLPKELPPAFFSDQFARYATSKHGRAVLSNYKPSDNFTECASYRLALPGTSERALTIPHPASFSVLASIIAKNFRRLLKKSSKSPFSKSRPIYVADQKRALHPMVKPSNLSRERAISRAGAKYIIKADVAQFYPSLYTHAVGWAIDPKLRHRENWANRRLLGKRVDQAIMDLQGKVSQGIPIGNDISYLLAEVVLSQIDKSLGIPKEKASRWFDDYEIACDSREQAEQLLTRLTKRLDDFQLRLNAEKTKIEKLPRPVDQEWKAQLLEKGKGRFSTPLDMVHYFDFAFRLREDCPDAPILLYALGMLFRLRRPKDGLGAVAQSGITQALLAEPGCSQKAFALLSFWSLNGLELDDKLLSNTIERMIQNYVPGGLTSDIAWALAFCIERQLPLTKKSAKILSASEENCVALQALHLNSLSLLPDGFNTSRISKKLKDVHLDGDSWLLAYEAVRQGFLPDSETAVKANGLFSDLLKQGVTFYRTKLPSYATVIHPGGAPDWIVDSWIHTLRSEPAAPPKERKERARILELISEDLNCVDQDLHSDEETVFDLLDVFEPEAFASNVDDMESYNIWTPTID